MLLTEMSSRKIDMHWTKMSPRSLYIDLYVLAFVFSLCYNTWPPSRSCLVLDRKLFLIRSYLVEITINRTIVSIIGGRQRGICRPSLFTVFSSSSFSLGSMKKSNEAQTFQQVPLKCCEYLFMSSCYC